MLNKEQCMKVLSELSEYAEIGREYHGARGQSVDTYVDERVTLLSDIICDYFSNPPLKFDELKEGMLVYDKNIKSWIEIDKTFEDIEKYVSCWSIGWPYEKRFPYEPNRFYRKEIHK